VSFNQAMIKAFEDILEEKLIIPEHRASIGAIGAALSLKLKQAVEKLDIPGLADMLDEHLKNFKYKKETFAPLSMIGQKLPSTRVNRYNFGKEKVDAYIGIDVGSISTNVVAIDKDKKLIEEIKLMLKV